MIPRIAAAGLGLVLLALVALAGVDSCRRHQGGQAEQQAQQHIQEAEHHAGAAEALPDHTQAIQRAEARATSAEADVARERSENARLRRLVEAERWARVSDPAGPDAPGSEAVPVDHRDELLAADVVLIAKLDAQVAALKGENGELRLALGDEQKRSSEWKAAYESERKATAAQAAATKAWREAVTTSRWRGRIEGFAAGVALGYVARGQR